MSTSDDEAGVSNLPYANGETFDTLDEYLAHLEKQSAIGLPYWRRIGGDEYEWVTTMRTEDATRETATRSELMARYGFKR